MSKKAKDLVTRVTERIECLAKLTDEAAKSQSMIAFMESLAKFYKYSLNNVFLILIQNPDASHVAGYMDWKNKHNRQVRKGEKGIKILAPCKYKLDPENDDSPYEIRGFRVVTVFDVSQTDGEELPDAPNWKSPEKSSELESRLIQFAQVEGIKIELDAELPNGAQGSSHGGLIKLAPEAGTKTLIHEIAHELLHKEKKSSREIMELEAESVAYVVGYTLGLKDLSSPNYLALWTADSEKIMDRADRIRKTAVLIIKGIS